MRRIKHTLLIVLLGAAPLLAPAPARALQLIQNFGFDTGTAGWAPCCGGVGTVTWDATQDAYGSQLSGSGKLAHTANPPVDEIGLSRCLGGPDVAPGTKLVAGMKLRFAAGESATGPALILVRFMSGANCAARCSPASAEGSTRPTSSAAPGSA